MVMKSSESAIRVSQETHGESLLVFNSREEAIIDGFKFGRASKEAGKGSTEANLMKEAFEQMAHQNEYLTRELIGTKSLLEQHKKLLDKALANQISTVDKCKESGT